MAIVMDSEGDVVEFGRIPIAHTRIRDERGVRVEYQVWRVLRMDDSDDGDIVVIYKEHRRG